LAGLISEADARRIAWGAAFGGAAIAVATTFSVFTGARSFYWLPNWAGICILVGLPTALLICLAFRIMRGAYSAPPTSAFARRATLACGFVLFAFLAGTLILLAAWLTALALGADIARLLVQALILTIALFVLARMTCLCIVNLAIAAQGPAKEQAALSADS
jgi:hypothetical protein